MFPDNFNNKAGKAINVETKKHGVYCTFIPDKLPVELDINNLSVLLEQAAQQLGRLNGIARLLPNPYLFTRLYTQKEAVMSSRIEGTQSSLEDVLIADAGVEMNNDKYKDKGRRELDLLEVRNLIKATEDGVASIKVGELDLQLMLRLHRILMEGARGGENSMGSIRRVPNWIGPQGTKIQDAKYVPPPPEYVPELLDNLLAYIRTDDNMPKLVKIAIAHYQFEAIHPFEDGNGRIGRLLLILYMLKSDLLDLPMLYLSEYFERNRTLYYDLLFKVSQKGAYDEWVSFFLTGIVEQSGRVVEKATMLLEYSDKMKSRMENERGRHIIDVFESLLSNPYVTITGIARREDISYPAAKRIVVKLVKFGVLSNINKGNVRGKIFASEEILKILNS